MEGAEEEPGATAREAVALAEEVSEGAPVPAVELVAVEAQQGAVELFERRRAALEEEPRAKH